VTGAVTGAATATMRCAVLTAPGETALEERRIPRPGPGEVLVRIEGSGVCGSNVPVWEGRPWFGYPLEPGAPGHEGWGVRTDTGERVALLSQHAFAEYDVAPASALVPLSFDGPFPGEALGCAVNVVRRARIRPGQMVAVVGMGFLGSVVTQLCELAGATVVPVRRDSDVAGLRSERVIECAGTQSALDKASALVATHGRLVVSGYHQDGPRTVDLQSWNWRGIDVVNAHERDPFVCVEGMREAVRLANGGELRIEPLLTHRFPLDQLGPALDAAASRPPGFVKAWVEP
jgi:threonine dehydrogenase-like Zn-dependent dehydrogenase